MTQRQRERPLTPETIAALADAYRQGLPQVHAAALAGVSARTMQRWIAAGQAELDARDDGTPPVARTNRAKPLGPYADLVVALKGADAAFLQEQLAVIRRAALSGKMTRTKRTVKDGVETSETTVTEGGFWQAASWLAERTHREFAERRLNEHTGADGQPIQVEDATDQALAGKVQAYLKGVADSTVVVDDVPVVEV